MHCWLIMAFLTGAFCLAYNPSPGPGTWSTPPKRTRPEWWLDLAGQVLLYGPAVGIMVWIFY